MSNLSRKIVTPQSILIEQTALAIAAEYYEIGRSQGLKSKHKNARAYARANVEKFIPLAVENLLKMLSLPHVPQEQKDLIYDAIMERTNDPELSNSGVKAFENNNPFLPDVAKKYDKVTLDNIFDQVMQKQKQDEKNKKLNNILKVH